MNKILIIAAHPDDEVLGCGGTVARLSSDNDIYTLILSEGIASRDIPEETKEEKKQQLREEAKKANQLLGVKEVFFEAFPDNQFATVPFLDIVKTIERVIEKTKPEIIYTHYGKDLNIDHRITSKAVITATRPLSKETVREIYAFEIPSSTEWNYPLSFSPDVYFDVLQGIDKKIEAMKAYKSELRESPHPRSIEGINLNAQYWGMRVGLNYAEAFKLVRLIK